MILHILIHADFETSSVLLDWARERSLEVRIIQRHRGEQLPSLSEVELLAVLGGPMSAYDPIPWIEEEAAYLAQAEKTGIKILGLCLGSQLLAKALGARVYPGSQPEIGWFPVQSSPDSLEAFPEVPQTWRVFHWHGDTYDPPAGVFPLGLSEITPCQGFFRPPQLLALQFHPEVTPEEIRGFEQAENRSLGMSPEDLALTAGNQALFRKMLDRWLQGIPNPPSCPLCSALAFPLVLDNPLDSEDVKQEFPDQFLNLRVPDPELLLFYRNTERRLLECPGCGRSFLYSQKPSGRKDWVKEVLVPLNPAGKQEELNQVEKEAGRQAQDFKTTYEANLPRIREAVARLREG